MKTPAEFTDVVCCTTIHWLTAAVVAGTDTTREPRSAVMVDELSHGIPRVCFPPNVVCCTTIE